MQTKERNQTKEFSISCGVNCHFSFLALVMWIDTSVSRPSSVECHFRFLALMVRSYTSVFSPSWCEVPLEFFCPDGAEWHFSFLDLVVWNATSVFSPWWSWVQFSRSGSVEHYLIPLTHSFTVIGCSSYRPTNESKRSIWKSKYMEKCIQKSVHYSVCFWNFAKKKLKVFLID